jgi:hypothetical protein
MAFSYDVRLKMAAATETYCVQTGDVMSYPYIVCLKKKSV